MLLLKGLWVLVHGSGFRVQGSGFRVQGLGFRVQMPWFGDDGLLRTVGLANLETYNAASGVGLRASKAQTRAKKPRYQSCREAGRSCSFGQPP